MYLCVSQKYFSKITKNVVKRHFPLLSSVGYIMFCGGKKRKKKEYRMRGCIDQFMKSSFYKAEDKCIFYITKYYDKYS